MNNIRELHLFLDNHNLKDGNQSVRFKSTVSYKTQNLQVQDNNIVSVNLNAWHDGDIEIMDGDVLNAELVHMGFTESYQTYEYDSATEELVISGSSPKAGGKYEVRLKPR
ncbi:MAG: hypothetical protein GC188_12940 [Alphaproteobacteria bacterium]|nr:hypothetical protein [Alphaproteobacteria bacterium]